MYRDADGDGKGNPNESIETCGGTEGYVDNADDCDDTDATKYPGADCIDANSCPGTMTTTCGCVSEGAPTWYEDADGDGWGSDNSMNTCAPGDGWVSQNGDCDDSDANNFPGAPC